MTPFDSSPPLSGTESATPLASQSGALTRFSRHYALVLMALVSASQATDRQLLSLVMEPIKREFGLSDTQAGFLNGTVFGTAYAIGALPFAVLADRWSRRKVIAATLAFWSAMTALTASAASYLGLVTTRALVGFGEAGAGPALLALLSRVYPPRQRASMVAALSVVTALAAFGAFWIAGVVVEALGWRAVFLVFGAAGALLALLIWRTLGDPPRAASPPTAAKAMTAEVRAVLLQRPLLHLFAAAGWGGIISAGTQSWMSAYLVRTFQMPFSRVGFWMGVAAACGGVFGSVIGGILTDRLAARDRLASMRLCVAVALLNLPLTLSILLVDSQPLVLTLLVASMTLGGVIAPPVASTMLDLMPDRVRATAMAILSMGILFVAGLGPTIVGALSDALAARGDAQSLRHALLAVAALGFIPAIHFFAVARSRERVVATEPE